MASCAPAVARPRHIEPWVTEKEPIVAFFWSDPPEELSRLRAAGSHIRFQVGSLDEAKASLRRGAQGLVVQGSGAGDHNRAAAAAFSLLTAVIDAVPSVPVVASGGIADGRTFAAALALGADAVWVGTRLLASFEANAHPQYNDRGIAAGVGDTARHLIVGPEFPDDASTHGLRNRIVRARLVLELAVIVVSGADDLVRSLSADVIGARRRFRRFASVRPSPCLGRPMCEELAIRADSSAQVMMWSRLRRAV